MSHYTKSEWQRVKANATARWQSFSSNPLLPTDYKAAKVAYFLAVEEAADNALTLIQSGHSLEEAAQMACDFLDWKLEGDA
jgi:hypothetical protein